MDNKTHQALHWRINCFCNRRCSFCYGPQKLHEVKFEESQAVLDRLIEYGISTFILTGGEPLMSTKIDKVLRFLRKRSVKIVLYTNCDLFFDLHEETLTECVDTLCVPIEGASEYVHDSVRGRNSLRAVLSVLDRYANSSGPFEFKVGTVLGRHNLHELPAINYLLEKYKVSVWKLYEYLKYTDRDLQKQWDKDQLGISAGEFRAAVGTLQSLPNRKTKIAISSEYDRDASYFMMNPDLDIIVPMRAESGLFEDRILCSALTTPVADIESLWRESVNLENYSSNLRVSLF